VETNLDSDIHGDYSSSSQIRLFRRGKQILYGTQVSQAVMNMILSNFQNFLQEFGEVSRKDQQSCYG
jgi:hypothetical protein